MDGCLAMTCEGEYQTDVWVMKESWTDALPSSRSKLTYISLRDCERESNSGL